MIRSHTPLLKRAAFCYTTPLRRFPWGVPGNVGQIWANQQSTSCYGELRGNEKDWEGSSQARPQRNAACGRRFATAKANSFAGRSRPAPLFACAGRPEPCSAGTHLRDWGIVRGPHGVTRMSRTPHEHRRKATCLDAALLPRRSASVNASRFRVGLRCRVVVLAVAGFTV